jgi:hypothetical protein
MKYIKTLGDIIYSTDNLKQSDLISLKEKRYDCVIDVENEKYFDAEKNEWKDIIKV